MLTKRVILANSSRLLREMLHRVIEKADHLEVVQELPNDEHLLSAIRTHDPDWVILSAPYDQNTHHWINTGMTDHPSVRFLFLSARNGTSEIKWQTQVEEDLTNLSLEGFIGILEKDLQHT
jgi:DNA-binding NarL/FixJ family response regulator